MTRIVFLHDLVEENGKTIKENNLAKPHTIPIGALVEIKSYQGARVFVCAHSRDCDGTPLYLLSPNPESILWDTPNAWPDSHHFWMGRYMGSFSRGGLTVIREWTERTER